MDKELKRGQTVYVTKEHPTLSNTPTSGKIHSIGATHVVLKTTGGTGMYKVHKDNVSHARSDSWLNKKYTTEEAPTNAVGGGNIAGTGGLGGEPGVTPKWMKKHKEENVRNAPSPIMSPVQKRKTFTQFIQGR